MIHLKSKKSPSFLLLLLCISSFCGYGQNKPSIISHEVVPHWYVFSRPGYSIDSLENETPLTIKDFMSVCKQEFELGERDELRVKKDRRPISPGHIKYQQYYDGYEVETATVIVESLKDTITMVSAFLIGNLDLNTSSPISKSAALDTALSAIHERFVWQDSVYVNNYCTFNGCFDSVRYQRLLPKGDLCISRKFGADFEKDNFRFVWRFYVGTVSKEYRILVDANSGELFDVTDQTYYSGYGFGSVQTLYDGFLPSIMETYRPTLFGPWVLRNQKGVITLLDSIVISDLDNIWDDTISAPASTAHWIINELDEFFWIKYLNDTITENLLINAGIDTLDNAIYYPNRNAIHLGKINDKWLSTIDIIGHELTHKLVFQTANLNHYGESGALNESFADVFGTLAERYIRTKLSASWNWTIGEDAQTVRDMANPQQFNHPNFYHGPNWQSTSNPDQSNDYGGIHTNCGVSNKWFYNLSQAIGPDKAGLVVYYMLNLYLSPNSNFETALCASVFAAENLYGTCSDERNAVVSAWCGVGVMSTNITDCSAEGNETNKYNTKSDTDDAIIASVFPNPISKEINVVIPNHSSNCLISIYSMFGEKINDYVSCSDLTTINADCFPNGLYFLTVNTKDTCLLKTKIIVNK